MHLQSARPAPLLALLALILLAATALAQDTATFRKRLADAKVKLATIETTLSRPSVDDVTLLRLRNEMDPLRLELVTLQGDAAGPRDAAKARLDKLGPPPKAEEPPESDEVQAVRKREQAEFGDLDGIIKEAQLQVVRADQLTNSANEKRREAFTQALTERSSSILDPYFWLGVVDDLPRAGWSLALTVHDASNYFQSRFGSGALLLALAITVAGYILAYYLRFRIRQLRQAIARRADAAHHRFYGALEVVLSIVYAMMGWPMLALVPILAFRTADLFPERIINQLGIGIVVALLIAVVYDATGEGLLAVDKPALRVLPLSDWAVKRIRRRTRWVAIILGLYVLAQSIGKAIYAPVSLTVAATAISSLLFALVSVTLLMRLRSAPTGAQHEGVAPPDEINRLDILRPMLWIAVIAIIVSLLAGYVALAGFFAFVPLAIIFVAAIAYILMTLIDTGLAQGLSGDGTRSRAVARAIGVSHGNVAFAATLLSGVLRFLVLAVAAMVMVAPLGFYSADMLTVVRRAFFGFQIGEISVSPSGILLGALLLVAILVATRLVQNWIRGTLLPRTTLDAGLQNSIATIIGYVGAVLAIAVGLSEVGINLQSFAIVAGALSVGIGFGLQSIVSNFVSGLILLAERPIRVGDIIAVSGEEGFVRRISVRATEIETYDRATLIIPNSQLITGTVKNWVYGNTWSRVRVSVSVGYDSDIEAVRAAMLAAAGDDPRILPSPPPRVFLAKLGDAALEFELVAVIASVETLPAVRSDLQYRILKNFREKSLRVVAQLPAAPAPIVVSLDEALRSVDQAQTAGNKVPEG